MAFLLVRALLLHGLGEFPGGSPLRLPLLLLLSAEGAHAPFHAARGAKPRSGAAPPLASIGRRLPAVQQRLIAGELVQQRIIGH